MIIACALLILPIVENVLSSAGFSNLRTEDLRGLFHGAQKVGQLSKCLFLVQFPPWAVYISSNRIRFSIYHHACGIE